MLNMISMCWEEMRWSVEGRGWQIWGKMGRNKGVWSKHASCHLGPRLWEPRWFHGCGRNPSLPLLCLEWGSSLLRSSDGLISGKTLRQGCLIGWASVKKEPVSGQIRAGEWLAALLRFQEREAGLYPGGKGPGVLGQQKWPMPTTLGLFVGLLRRWRVSEEVLHKL